MLYDSRSATLLETVAFGLIRSDGSTLDEAGVEALAKLQGTSTSSGPVERVALVFMDEGEARQLLAACKRFGVQCRAFTNAGTEETLFDGARVTFSDTPPDGPLLPIIREASWPRASQVAKRRLFKTIDDGPWVTFARDLGTSLASLPLSELERRPLAELEAEALANLEKRSFSIEQAGGATQLLDEYAMEALLLPRVCARLCQAVGEPLCLVATREGVLLAAGATNVNMIAVAEKMFHDAKGRRLAPMPVLVSAEGVQGFAVGAPAGVEAAKASKPWWKFW
jgi:hypothetical protein